MLNSGGTTVLGHPDKTLYKFLLVGLINTALGASVMFVAYNMLGLSYWLSSAANYIVGSTLSYFLNKYYTFQNNEHSLGMIFKFILHIAACYFLAYYLAMKMMHWLLAASSVSTRDNIALLCGMCLFTYMNYLGQHFFVFAKKRKKLQ